MEYRLSNYQSIGGEQRQKTLGELSYDLEVRQKQVTDWKKTIAGAGL
jgi:hypothetical protein